jgi:hypothetical protein
MLLPQAARLPALSNTLNTREQGTSSFGLAECDAIVAGVRAAEVALRRAECSGVLRLFENLSPAKDDDPKLVALGVYAELRRALFRQKRRFPATSLAAAGYSFEEVACIDALIDALAAGSDT